MFKICLEGSNKIGVKNTNDYEELIRMFLSSDDYELIGYEQVANDLVDNKILNSEQADIRLTDKELENSKDDSNSKVLIIPDNLLSPTEKKEDIKKLIYESLSTLTGKSLKWGTLTGVKPLKLYNNLLKSNKEDINATKKVLREKYLVDESRIDLLEEINLVQEEVLGKPKPNEVSIYIGIPFCPTRCTYCSFTSNQKEYKEIIRYLEALYKEIEYVAKHMKRLKLKAETIYIGGGTPTTLKSSELNKLLEKVNNQIPKTENWEFTVEAGRPDTIDDSKLKVMVKEGVNRISINPQTMNDHTLAILGRDHNTDQIRKAFDKASEYEFEAINTDIIAGLPGESEEDFKRTVNEVCGFEPENITVHTLAIKKSSKLMDKLYELDIKPEEASQADNSDYLAAEMLAHAEKSLKEKGYRPYYIYRQKYMADNLENVGYAKAGTECKYNIRIMEEKQTVIAMGAGGSTKVFFPEEDRLERVMNVSNYEQYIDRIDEMIDRKQKNLFNE